MRWAVVSLAAVVAAACSSDEDTLFAPPMEDARFVVQVVNETFTIKVTNPSAYADLEARRKSGQIGVISGRIVRGDGGFNTGYSWHLDPATVEVVDLAIEVCDGRPSDLEEDLDYWADTVKNYCPWGAKVVSVQ